MGHLTDDDPEKCLPPRSTTNGLWFGERSELMKGTSIPSKLLICPVRQKVYIVKLKAIGKKVTRQRLGSTIAFPQENVLMHPEGNLSHNISELSRSLYIIFIGSKSHRLSKLMKK
jgi:hypothetical protein